MINRLSSASTQAAQRSILNLTTAVEQILHTSEDVSRRAASMETRFASSSRYPESTLRPAQNNDDASTIISLAQDLDQDTNAQSIRQKGDREEPSLEEVDVDSASTPKVQSSFLEQNPSSSVGRQEVRLDPTLESELYASRVYSRNTHRHSISSLFSTEHSAAGLSILSGLSLAQISNLSVFSLPVFCHELWNPQLYETSQHSRRAASPIAEEPSTLGVSWNELLTSFPKVQVTAESTRSAQRGQTLRSDTIPLKNNVKIVLLGKCSCIMHSSASKVINHCNFTRTS